MAVSQLFLVLDANYFASSPSLEAQPLPSLRAASLCPGTSTGADLPGRPAAPGPRSLHHPPPWFPGQKDKEHVVQIPEPGQSLEASGGDREDWENRGGPECPGEETDSSHWIKTTAPGNSLVVQWL